MKKKYYILSIAIFLILTFTLFEITSRYINPRFFIDETFELHPTRGWLHVKDLGKYSHTHGYSVLTEFNRDGFRDLNYPQNKPEGVYRVAVIGDSFSDALQVNREDTYWYLLKQKIRALRTAFRIEVMNFGVGDYGTIQQYLTLKEHVLAYQPDVVILQVFALNDILNNSLAGWGLSSPQDVFRPYIDLDSKDLPIVYAQPIRNFLRTRSRFFATTEHLFYKFVGKPFPRTQEYFDMKTRETSQKFKLAKGTFEAAPNLNTFAPEAYQIPAVKYGWTATEAAFKKIVDTCEEKKVKLIVLSIPHSVQFSHADKPERDDMEFPLMMKSADERIKGYFEPQGIPVVTLIDDFSQHENDVAPYISGHLNRAAHKLVAEKLAPEFEFYKLPPKLNYSTSISFENPMLANRSLISGFRFAELGNSWSIEEVAKLHFLLDESNSDQMVLRIWGMPFNPPNLKRALKSEVFIGKKRVAQWALQGHQQYRSLDIPLDSSMIPKNRIIELEWRFENLSSPLKAGTGDDPAKLGIAINRISLIKANQTIK